MPEGEESERPQRSASTPDEASERIEELERTIQSLQRKLGDSPRHSQILQERIVELQFNLAGIAAQNERLANTLREARETISTLKGEAESASEENRELEGEVRMLRAKALENARSHVWRYIPTLGIFVTMGIMTGVLIPRSVAYSLFSWTFFALSVSFLVHQVAVSLKRRGRSSFTSFRVLLPPRRWTLDDRLQRERDAEVAVERLLAGVDLHTFVDSHVDGGFHRD